MGRWMKEEEMVGWMDGKMDDGSMMDGQMDKW